MIEEKIIVLGLSPTGKYVGKEAYNFKIKCLAFDFKKGAGYYSKYFEKAEILSEEELIGKFKNDFLNTNTNYYVCPTSDEWIDFINRNKDVFINTNIKTDESYLDNTYNLLADKFELLKVSEKLKLNYPNSMVFVPGKEKLPNLENFIFPIFVKPVNRTGLASVMQGKKGWLFDTEDEFKAFDSLAKLINIELLIQEVIIGGEENIKVLGTVANKENRIQSWLGIKYRQYPYGFGSASLLVETSDEELEVITDKLLEETKYSGFFALETKYCVKRKETYIIEVNTRPGLWFGATTTANCNFVIKWFNNLRDKDKEIALPQYNISNKKIVWRYFYKDLYVKMKVPKNNSLQLDKIGGFKNSYAVFDWNDKKPFIFDVINGIKKIVGRK